MLKDAELQGGVEFMSKGVPGACNRIDLVIFSAC